MPWYLWRPCVGIPGLLPPLAQWVQMLDGTLTLDDVRQMHEVMDAVKQQADEARQSIA